MINPIVDQMIGRTVAQYEILARRGGGGMGVVYEARDTKLGRRVALKFLPPQWSHDEAAKQRFVREAQAASATDHPNICTIHDIGTTDDGQLFIVMAYYDGETLKQRLAAGALPPQEALDIATQVADGLAKAHAHGVVHRDIKPGNLILTEDGVRIVDFGLATFADALQLTVPGSTLGTAAYMSPEQARGEEADARSDVWAVGVVLYEMLAGHVPFRGAYPEAIAYAIRNDPPAPLRDDRPDLPEDVERVVFRALHKDPAIRYKNGRELARALRQAQGFSVPAELRTQAVDVPQSAAPARRGRASRSSLWVVLAATILVGAAGGAWWLNSVERMAVLVAPVANQTGDQSLEPFRLALTHALINRLSSSRDLRPVPYREMLPAIRRFVDGGELAGISSRDAIQAFAQNGPAEIVIVPVLIYEDGAYVARVEFRDAQTQGNVGIEAVVTTPQKSSLAAVTAYGFVDELADGIAERLKSPQSRVIDVLAAPVRAAFSDSRGSGLASVHAAQAFEEGIRAFEGLEYSAARDAFARAEQADPQHPLPAAWTGRVLALMGQQQAAVQAAGRAERLLTARTPRDVRLFIEAVIYEIRREMDDAESRYRALSDDFAGDARWTMELAGFQDRRGNTAEAVNTYNAALAQNPHLVRPHLELCRLYNSTRMIQPDLAIASGERARDRYARLGDEIGEAQALLCLGDILWERDGAQAAAVVERARAVFEQRRAPYNLARALHYAALARARSAPAEAVALWNQSLAAAEQVDSLALQGIVLTNLGAAHESLGNIDEAADYYTRSYRVNERLGDQRHAAYVQANAGALQISRTGNPEEGLRNVRNALAVVQTLDEKNFEVFCIQLVAAFYRFTAQYSDSIRELARAEAIANEIGDPDALASLAIDRAQVLAETGDYARALETLQPIVEKAPDARRAEAQLVLGRIYTSLGDSASAGRVLTDVAPHVMSPGGRGLAPALHLARGHAALEEGRAHDARKEFGLAANFWGEKPSDAASVEAAAYVGWLAAREGRTDEGLRTIRGAVDHAEKMQRVPIEVRGRILLARVLLEAKRPQDAAEALTDVPLDRLGPELRAQVHYWRARALEAAGDHVAARSEAAAVRPALEELLRGVPDAFRTAVESRRDIAELLHATGRV